MKKFFSLLKAVMSQDMKLFRYKTKKNASNFSKIIVPVLLGLLVMYAVGTMYLPLAIELDKVNMMQAILALAIAFPSLIALMEGIYKSQSVLFEAKDSELLFALPISKKQIILARLVKLFVFQFLYNLLFFIPGIAIHAFYTKPTAYFYIISTIMLILTPIIPTVIGCFLGYIIKKYSVKFKAKKAIQLLLTLMLIIGLMAFSLSEKSIVENYIDNVTEINNKIESYYYPVKAYTSLINEFNILTLICLVLINILSVVIFVLIVTKSYFGIVSKSKEDLKPTRKEFVSAEKLQYKKKSQLRALLKKEFNRYFSSNVYVINTIFGLFLLLLATVGMCLNFDGVIDYLSQGEVSAEDINTLFILAPKVYLSILIAMSFMTSITSSSISLEGKSFNILKSLPAKVDTILFAKVLMSNIITIPIILVCDVVFCMSFNVSFIDALLILISTFVAPSIAAIFGLVVNLKYPKMDATSDTEVVKQSMSSMVAVFCGIFLASIFVVLTFLLAGFGDIAMIGEIVLLCAILLITWVLLVKYGKKRFKEIEV